ncbi:MAG: type II toxin-antitoxin system VapC family toxin [Pirellulales bacterium]
MRILLDSHTLLWAVDDPTRLGAQAVVALRDPANELLLSAATIWEIAIKVGLKKLKLSMAYRQWMLRAMADLKVGVLPITVEYADVQAMLPNYHRDPFDRLIAAQAQVENVALVSADPVFEQYGISRLW